jgi:hypothetical protein
MFDLWGTRKQCRKGELRYAILDGHGRALQLMMGTMIDLMPQVGNIPILSRDESE